MLYSEENCSVKWKHLDNGGEEIGGPGASVDFDWLPRNWPWFNGVPYFTVGRNVICVTLLVLPSQSSAGAFPQPWRQPLHPSVRRQPAGRERDVHWAAPVCPGPRGHPQTTTRPHLGGGGGRVGTVTAPFHPPHVRGRARGRRRWGQQQQHLAPTQTPPGRQLRHFAQVLPEPGEE